MASSIVLKKLISPSLLCRSLRPAVATAQPISHRLFNTNAVRDYDSDDRDVETDRFGDRRVFSPLRGVFGPFSARSGSLSQLLNMMDQFAESPVSSSVRRNWNVRETDDGLHLRVDMPGLGKEDVKVCIEQNTLMIRGEVKEESDEEDARRYSSRIDLPKSLYKANEIKAEMKNGILRVFVPKMKEEERSDVFQVRVE
ncbi:hypothetical protein M569_03477 [Genlisea aurea]|uniref:SHSP domain-containing protein n=1 Tax=Genlisea aurea TaxID=192259 RepID=S8EFC9_9LAMI|nr:hypothetical protein M569_03477 [Genlisea aurea]